MSFDLYAGALNKFYARDFQTAQARMAQELGYDYKLVIPEDADQPLSPDMAFSAVEKFKKRLVEIEVPIDVTWNENIDRYFSEQIHHECYNALLHLASLSQKKNIILPKKLKDLAEFSFEDAGLTRDEYINGPCLTIECQMFFPSEEFSVFHDTNPQGNTYFGTTLGLLERQLSNIAREIWKDNVRVDEWMSRGPLSIGSTFKQEKGFFPWQKKIVEIEAESEVDDEVLHSAEYAFAVFSKALAFAKENNVPICLDP